MWVCRLCWIRTGILTVEYPVSTRRYLRLTIPGWNDPAYLQSAWLTYRKEADAVRDVMATLTPVVSEDPKRRLRFCSTLVSRVCRMTAWNCQSVRECFSAMWRYSSVITGKSGHLPVAAFF